MSRVVVYGAAGYAGALCVGAMRARRLDVREAGRRDAAADDPAALDRLLDGATVVLNAAGPFRATTGPLVEACLRTRTHMLDLAGEVDDHLAVAARDAQARDAGVMLLPGAGFGVVPTDCLAAHVASRLGAPAQHLTVAFQTIGGASRGTLLTVLEDLAAPGHRRRGGVLVAVRAAEQRVTLDLGGGETTVVTNPWRADLASAALSTGAADIDTLAAVPAPIVALMARPQLARRLRPALRVLAARLPAGPSASARAKGATHVWAQARSADGRTATARLHGPEAYAFTAATAALLAQRILDAGDPPAGHQTPATAFGPDLVLEVEGVSRVDELVGI